ncbi:MAG TPA: hypothetical protein VGA45_16965, partial [Actinomycetota bacterium]
MGTTRCPTGSQGVMRFAAGAAHRVTYNPMVVDQLTGEGVDQLFHALADATRRDILRRCAAG